MSEMVNGKLLDRVRKPNYMYSYCRVIGCPNPASAGTSSGLNRLYCRKHEDHYERHGSYTKKSYTASQINPYRRLAMRWLEINLNDPVVNLAIKGVEAIYRNAGQHVEAFRLRGLTPLERSKAAWARLRKSNVSPLKILASLLAIEMLVLDDHQPESKSHFKLIQGAKLIHRLSSGSHRRWEHVDSTGKIRVEELHKYPRSRGRVLLHMSKHLQKVGELLVSTHLEKIRLQLSNETDIFPKGI